MKRIKQLFLCLMMILSVGVWGQNQWYFGDKAGLQFNSDGTTSGLSGNLMTTGEGCSMAFNEDGSLKFYTDGRKVYYIKSNGMHKEMDENLDGSSSSTHSAIILPLDCRRYAIFTVKTYITDGRSTSVNDLKYSILNFSSPDNPFFEGSPNRKLQNVNATEVFSEKLAAYKISDGNYWLVAHNFSTNSIANKFYIFNISDTNLSANNSPVPTVQSIGGSHSSALADIGGAIGQIKFSNNGKMLGLARKDAIEWFDFTNGVISNPRSVSSLGWNYGVEFSPQDRYLYFSQWQGSVKRIIMANNTIDPTDFESSNVDSNGKILDLYCGMQLGPNNKLYCLIDSNYSTDNHNSLMMEVGDLDNPDLRNIRYNNKRGITFNGKGIYGLPTIVKNLQGCGGSSSCEVKCCLPITFSNKQMLLENRNTRIFNFQNNPVNATAAFDYIVRQDFLDLMNSHINTVNIEARGYSCPEVTFTPSLNVYRYNNTSNSIGQQQIEQAFAADRSQFTLIGAIDNFSHPNQIIAPLPTQINHFIVEFEAKWKGIGNCSSSIFTGTTIQGGGTKANSNGGVKVPKN